MNKSKTVVWLEDHFRNFEEIVKILEALGLNVKKVSSEDEFEAAMDDGCQYGILDNKIGDRSSVGSRLMDRLSATSAARLLMFTAYLPSTKTDNSFERTLGGGHAGFLSKRFSDFSTVREFWEHSANSIHRFFTVDDPTAEKRVDEDEPTAFAEFRGLSLSQQGVRFRQAAEANKEFLESLWEKGAITVILPGGDIEGYKAYFTRDELPELSASMAEFEKKGIYPYVYSNEYSFDDTNCHSLVREDSVRTYPRMALGVDGPQHAFHFDTGADTSIFCESYLNEVGGASVVEATPFPLLLHGKPHAALKVVLATYLHNNSVPDFPKMEPVEINGLMVDEWQTARIQVQCSEQCGNKDADRPNCIYRRNGLLGRDLYADNELQVLVSYEEAQVAVKRKK